MNILQKKNTNFSIKMSKPIPLADKTIPHQVSNPLQNVQNQVSSNTSAINSMQNSLQQTSITLSYNTNNITLLNPSEVDTVDQIKNYILQVSNVELNYIGTPNVFFSPQNYTGTILIKGQAIYLPEQGVYQLFEMYFVNQNVINQSDNDFENQISPQTLLSGNITSVSTKDSNDKFYIVIMNRLLVIIRIMSV